MVCKSLAVRVTLFAMVVLAGLGQVRPTPFPLLDQTESDQRLILKAYLELDNAREPLRWNGIPIFIDVEVQRLAQEKEWAFDMIRERIRKKLWAVEVAEFEAALVSILQGCGNPKTLEAMHDLFKGRPNLEYQLEGALIYGYGHTNAPESIRRWYEGLEHADPVVRRVAQRVVGKLFDNPMESDGYVRYVTMWADGLLVRYGSTPTPEQLLTDPLFDAIRQRNPGRSLVTRAQLLELTKRREGERRSVKPKTTDAVPKDF